jgi:hypothetical protein
MEKEMTKMSNSPLITYKKLSPNHSGQRKQKIDTITPHCVVGHLSLQTLGNVFAPESRRASSNYGIDDNGKVGMYVEEKNRSWCTSSSANDNRAITIEIASDQAHPYKITDDALQGLIDLSVDICKRNGIPKLLWKNDKSLIGNVSKQNLTIHRWFANKSCPGDYIVSQLGYVADEVNKILIPTPTIVAPVVKPKPSLGYTVRIEAKALHYRKGPGTNYPVLGIVRKGEVYTIVEEAAGRGSSKWGKLKSGAGWISLGYCIRM